MMWEIVGDSTTTYSRPNLSEPVQKF